MSPQKYKKLKVASASKMAIAEALSRRIAGQPQAIECLTQVFTQSRLRCADPIKPKGAVLLLGPTGTGKTALVEAFTEYLLGAGEKPVKLNCGEYQMEHDIVKLFGPNPGYLGFTTTPPFFSRQRIEERFDRAGKRCQVLLLDEFEKAHQRLFDTLLGILDKGEFTNATGELVNFSHCYILMTSNLGSSLSEIRKANIGFGSELSTTEKVRQAAVAAAKKEFRPEFWNRLSDYVVFNALDEATMRQILMLELVKLKSTLFSQHEVTLHVEEKALQFLMLDGYNPAYGARHLQRAIQRHILRPLSLLFAEHKQPANGAIYVQAEAGSLSFYEERAAAAGDGQ